MADAVEKGQDVNNENGESSSKDTQSAVHTQDIVNQVGEQSVEDKADKIDDQTPSAKDNSSVNVPADTSSEANVSGVAKEDSTGVNSVENVNVENHATTGPAEKVVNNSDERSNGSVDLPNTSKDIEDSGSKPSHSPTVINEPDTNCIENGKEMSEVSCVTSEMKPDDNTKEQIQPKESNVVPDQDRLETSPDATKRSISCPEGSITNTDTEVSSNKENSPATNAEGDNTNIENEPVQPSLSDKEPQVNENTAANLETVPKESSASSEEPKERQETVNNVEEAKPQESECHEESGENPVTSDICNAKENTPPPVSSREEEKENIDPDTDGVANGMNSNVQPQDSNNSASSQPEAGNRDSPKIEDTPQVEDVKPTKEDVSSPAIENKVKGFGPAVPSRGIDDISQKIKNQPPVPARAEFAGDVYDNMSRDVEKPPTPPDLRQVSRAPTIPPRKVGIRSQLTNQSNQQSQPPPPPVHPILQSRKKLSESVPPEPPPRSALGLAALRHNSEKELKQSSQFDKPHPILSRMYNQGNNPPPLPKTQASISGRPPPKLPPRPVPVGRSTSQENMTQEKPATPDRDDATKVVIIDPVAKEVKRVSKKSSGALSREASVKKIDDKRSSVKLGKQNTLTKSEMHARNSKTPLSSIGSSLDELPDAPPAPGFIDPKKEQRDNAINNLKEDLKEGTLGKNNSFDMKNMKPLTKKQSSLDAQSISTTMTESASCSRANSVRSLKSGAKRNRHKIDRKLSNMANQQWYRSCKAVSTISFLLGFVGGGVICGIVVFLIRTKGMSSVGDNLADNSTSVYGHVSNHHLKKRDVDFRVSTKSDAVTTKPVVTTEPIYWTTTEPTTFAEPEIATARADNKDDKSLNDYVTTSETPSQMEETKIERSPDKSTSANNKPDST